MYILGISGGFRQGNMDGAACLIKDNRIIAAAEEERFVRIKHAPGLIPLNAVKFCLKEAGISIKEVGLLVFAGATYKDIKGKLERYFVFKLGFCPKVELVEHHIAHASSAFFVSGFEESAILTMDLSGDGVSTLMAKGKAGKISKVREFKRPNSLGAFYNVITQYLGFNRNNDEYKVMGLASYGRPVYDLSWMLKATPEGYSFNTSSMLKVSAGHPFPSVQEPVYSKAFLKRFSKPRIPGSKVMSYHMDFAASAQRRLEEVICHLAKLLHEEVGSRNICIAGGVGLNCVANARLRELPFIDNIFVQPASSDAGLAMGAALKAAVDRGFRFTSLKHAYWGPGYGDKDIERLFKDIGCRYKRSKDIAAFAAKQISQGKIVGWFQGRMEYGPRALGARSIVADPRRKDMKDKINKAVKFRESFRPFAPAVLEEYAEDYFIGCTRYPFMTVNFDVRSEMAGKIPAVVHVDSTSRVQTVCREDNRAYYDLIREFYRITSVPVILNTSFNVREEPIVCTPYQAVSTFFESGLDYLAIGNFILSKRGL